MLCHRASFCIDDHGWWGEVYVVSKLPSSGTPTRSIRILEQERERLEQRLSDLDQTLEELRKTTVALT